MKLQEKIKALIKQTSQGVFERDEAIKLSFVALLSGESIFLLGQPGVGKSLLARRIKDSLEGGKNFEYLMNRFSTPEEIFGPISLKLLDEDRYERVVDGYLPTADVAFLDEIWKASPAIQNTLLTIINEKIFRNGSSDLNVPLKILISASNELPAPNEGLDALFDRFIIRYYVENIKSEQSFNKLMKSQDEYVVDENLRLSLSDLAEARKMIDEVEIGQDIFDFIHLLRKKLVAKLGEKAPYVSDRRWKKIFSILRSSAWVSLRKTIGPSDLLLIPFMIWENEEQFRSIGDVFTEVWADFVSSESLAEVNSLKQLRESSENKFTLLWDKNKAQKRRIFTTENNQSIFEFYKFEVIGWDKQIWLPLKGNKIAKDTLRDKDYVQVYWDDGISQIRDKERIEYFDMKNKRFKLIGKEFELVPVIDSITKMNLSPLKNLHENILLETLDKSDLQAITLSRFNKLKEQNSVVVENYELKLEMVKGDILERIWNETKNLTFLKKEIASAIKEIEDGK